MAEDTFSYAALACQNCGASGGPHLKLLKCAACKHATYCGADCQKAHWKKHKPACKARQELNSRMAELGKEDVFRAQSKWLTAIRGELNFLVHREIPADAARTHVYMMHVGTSQGPDGRPKFKVDMGSAVAIELVRMMSTEFADEMEKQLAEARQFEKNSPNGRWAYAIVMFKDPPCLRVVPCQVMTNMPFMPWTSQQLIAKIDSTAVPPFSTPASSSAGTSSSSKASPEASSKGSSTASSKASGKGSSKGSTKAS